MAFVDFDFPFAPQATTELSPTSVVITKPLMRNTDILGSGALIALTIALTAAPLSARNEKKEAQVAAQDSDERKEGMEEKSGGTVARRSYTPEDFARFAPRPIRLGALPLALAAPLAWARTLTARFKAEGVENLLLRRLRLCHSVRGCFRGAWFFFCLRLGSR